MIDRVQDVKNPPHDSLQHGGQEPHVPASLLLFTAGDRVGDITEASVVANQCLDLSFQHVNQAHNLGSVDSITGKL
jgi:hypothetical protein